MHGRKSQHSDLKSNIVHTAKLTWGQCHDDIIFNQL